MIAHLWEWLKLKKKNLPQLSGGKDSGCPLLTGMQSCRANVENSFAVSYKVTTHLPYDQQSHSWLSTPEKWKFTFTEKPIRECL